MVLYNYRYGLSSSNRYFGRILKYTKNRGKYNIFVFLYIKMKHLALPLLFTLLVLMSAACSTGVPQPSSTATLSAPAGLGTAIDPSLPSATPGFSSPPVETTNGQLSGTPFLLPTETLPSLPTQTFIPTQQPTAQPTTVLPTEAISSEFDSFVLSVKNGNANQIVGVYVEGVLALRVVQQPPGQAAWVSTNDGEATEFLLAFTIAGNIGLLAHNYLSGRYFFNLQPGDIVQLIYGDGSYREFEIADIRSYQALSPQSPNSDFVDLVSGETYSATNLFYRVYGGEYHLTFQTCIERDNNSEWGRLFPMAYPYP